MKKIRKEKPSSIVFLNGWWRNDDFYSYKQYVDSFEEMNSHYPLYSDCDNKDKTFSFTTFYRHVRDIQDYLTENQIESCDLICHSYGGLVGRFLAVNDKRISSVTYISSLPERGIKGKGKIILQLGWGSFVKMMSLQRIPYRNEKGKIKRGKHSLVSAIVLLQVWRGILVKKLRCPSLAVVTLRDGKVSPEIQENIAKKHNSDIIKVDYGHDILLQDYDVSVLRLILNWINNNYSLH